MIWWDDLWLNESFAEFFSFFILKKIKGSLSYPLTDIAIMQQIRKSAGYVQDQQATTHPIAGPVRNTLEAASIFDGITYNKGGAVLRQLMYLIGEETFALGLYYYFNKYHHSNTNLDMFLEQMQLAVNFDKKFALF